MQKGPGDVGAPGTGSLLGGNELRAAFEAGARCLERQRDAINALNVFPVPDGDTGTNMLLTMRSVNEACLGTSGSTLEEVAAAMARGALLGARGNSGVILSQFFQGLAQGAGGKSHFDGHDLAQAFNLASRAAYSSVSKPVDGTMLTVLRELSLAASRHSGSSGGYGDVLSVWQAALEAAKEALSRTPLQLPVLREAGVVDAGGQGVVTLLEGAWLHLAGESVEDHVFEVCAPAELDPAMGVPGAGTAVHQEYLDATEDELYGYCTQLLIQGDALEVGEIRAHMGTMAQSTVVVGNEQLVRVHVHAHDPGPVISYAVTQGIVSQVALENIDQQHREFVDAHRAEPTSGAGTAGRATLQAVVAVAWGEGFTSLFSGLGCSLVVTGGQTLNPSTRDLLEAAQATGASDVILLPNNSNVIPAASQAVNMTNGTGGSGGSGGTSGTGGGPHQGFRGGLQVHVVPSRTIPQGVAALLAYNPEGSLEGNLKAMGAALDSVRTVEVTTAVRPVTLGGVEVKEGQYIGLLEGNLVTAGDSALDALQRTMSLATDSETSRVDAPPPELVTLYWGADIGEGQAREAATLIRAANPGLEVEVVHGGQPYYQYVASLE